MGRFPFVVSFATVAPQWALGAGMVDRIEHNERDLRAWKFRTTLSFLFWGSLLIIGVLVTIYSGGTILTAALNNIRDWWHYKETSSSGNGFYIITFFVGGFLWIVSNEFVKDRDEDIAFNKFIRDRRRTEESIELERAREKSLWEKVFPWISVLWIVTILTVVYIYK